MQVDRLRDVSLMSICHTFDASLMFSSSFVVSGSLIYYGGV